MRCRNYRRKKVGKGGQSNRVVFWGEFITFICSSSPQSPILCSSLCFTELSVASTQPCTTTDCDNDHPGIESVSPFLRAPAMMRHAHAPKQIHNTTRKYILLCTYKNRYYMYAVFLYKRACCFVEQRRSCLEEKKKLYVYNDFDHWHECIF